MDIRPMFIDSIRSDAQKYGLSITEYLLFLIYINT